MESLSLCTPIMMQVEAEGLESIKVYQWLLQRKILNFVPWCKFQNSLIKRWIHLITIKVYCIIKVNKHKRTWFLIKYCVTIFFPLTEFDLFYQLSWFPLPFLFDLELKEEEIPRAEPATKDAVFTPFLYSFHIKEDNNVAVNTTKIPNKKSSILQLITYKTEQLLEIYIIHKE